MFTAAITRLRQHSTPYHLAHGLLDHAQHLHRTGDDEAAEAATAEARDIAGDRKSTRLNSSHSGESRMPSSA